VKILKAKKSLLFYALLFRKSAINLDDFSIKAQFVFFYFVKILSEKG